MPTYEGDTYTVKAPPQTMDSLDCWGNLHQLPYELHNSFYNTVTLYGLIASPQGTSTNTCENTVHWNGIVQNTITSDVNVYARYAIRIDVADKWICDSNINPRFAVRINIADTWLSNELISPRLALRVNIDEALYSDVVCVPQMKGYADILASGTSTTKVIDGYLYSTAGNTNNTSSIVVNAIFYGANWNTQAISSDDWSRL